MEIKIRTFKTEDKDAALQCIAVLKTVESAFDTDYKTGDEANTELLESFLVVKRENKGDVFVAIAGEKVVGFVAFEKTTKNEPLIVHAVPAIYISGFAVLPEYQQHGVGTKLIHEVETYANNNNITHIKLIMFSQNTGAQTFYEKAGFQPYEVTLLKNLN
jgi:ribosomal protein S18 acetylase RimI-like enzyme